MEKSSVYTGNNTPHPGRQRNASFELLRIICMLFIILSHFVGHGGWLDNMTGVNRVFAVILHAMFKPSVNLFVMISAYFLCTRQDHRVQWKKIGKLYAQMEFFNILLYALFLGCGFIKFDKGWLLDAIFPLARGKYWFFSAYVFMTLASPLLNMLIERLGKKQHFLLLLGFAFIGSLQSVFFGSMVPLNGGYTGVWFCMLYFFAAYIRKYDVSFKRKWHIAIGAAIYVVAIVIGCFAGGRYTDIQTIYATMFIFLLFKQIKITSPKISKVICKISSVTFGVYLIHDSPEMRSYMYQHIFFSYKFYGNVVSCLILVGFVLATFAVCGIVEYLRQLLFETANKIYLKTLKGKIHTPKFITALKVKFDSFFEPENDELCPALASPSPTLEVENENMRREQVENACAAYNDEAASDMTIADSTAENNISNSPAENIISDGATPNEETKGGATEVTTEQDVPPAQ